MSATLPPLSSGGPWPAPGGEPALLAPPVGSCVSSSIEAVSNAASAEALPASREGEERPCSAQQSAASAHERERREEATFLSPPSTPLPPLPLSTPSVPPLPPGAASPGLPARVRLLRSGGTTPASADASLLAAASNLTLIPSGGAASGGSVSLASMHASPFASSATLAGPGGHSGSAPPSPPARGQQALRIPIYSSEGRLVGYRQNSAAMLNVAGEQAAARAAGAPGTPGTPGGAGRLLVQPAGASEAASPVPPSRRGGGRTFAPGDEPLPLAAASRAGAAAPESPADRLLRGGPLRSAALSEESAPVPPPRRPPPPPPEEFAAAVADPCCGFPAPEEVVSGWLVGDELGRGGFCVVRRAWHLAAGARAAVKVIEKRRLRDARERERVEREVRVLRALGAAAGVVRLLHVADRPGAVYVFMEECAGGSLLDAVRSARRLDERAAARVFRALLRALDHVHAHGVVHRDVKLENVLFDERGSVRLIDFGLCGYYAPGRLLRCHCGSPSYAAPEIVARRDYAGPPVDVWSAGVVLFAMLAGHLPFHSRDKKQLSARILAGAYRVPDWLPSDARDLLARALCLDPQRRISLADAASHPWVLRASGPPERLARSQPPRTSSQQAVLEELARAGLDAHAVLAAVRARQACYVSAAFHLASKRLADEARGPGPVGFELGADEEEQEDQGWGRDPCQGQTSKRGAAPEASAPAWDFGALGAAQAGALAAALRPETRGSSEALRACEALRTSETRVPSPKAATLPPLPAPSPPRAETRSGPLAWLVARCGRGGSEAERRESSGAKEPAARTASASVPRAAEPLGGAQRRTLSESAPRGAPEEPEKGPAPVHGFKIEVYAPRGAADLGPLRGAGGEEVRQPRAG